MNTRGFLLALPWFAAVAHDAYAADPAPPAEPVAAAVNDAEGYTPSDEGSSLVSSGYIDVGFADAQGNGTSFPPGDTRLPADYGVDPFAPAVNSRGDVASTDSDGRFTNGFLPRSLGIGGRPSAFINTVSYELRYTTLRGKVMAFARAQLLPRFEPSGNRTLTFVDQAFVRLTPFDSQELSVVVGRSDSVFGIEYLEREAPLRTGITPSLLARYTTGPSVGAKLFYRVQLAPLWSALSLHASATNHGTLVEPLQTPEISLTGRPVGTGRLGYELNLPSVQVKLGASASRGPRNDQHDPEVGQRLYGADARITIPWVSLSGEWVRVDQDAGAGDKITGLGTQTIVSAFHARGFWAQLALQLPWTSELFRRAVVYGRYEERKAWFEGFSRLHERRITAGFRIDVAEALAFKGEALFNRELAGSPEVDNDVLVGSLVVYF